MIICDICKKSNDNMKRSYEIKTQYVPTGQRATEERRIMWIGDACNDCYLLVTKTVHTALTKLIN